MFRCRICSTRRCRFVGSPAQLTTPPALLDSQHAQLAPPIDTTQGWKETHLTIQDPCSTGTRGRAVKVKTPVTESCQPTRLSAVRPPRYSATNPRRSPMQPREATAIRRLHWLSVPERVEFKLRVGVSFCPGAWSGLHVHSGSCPPAFKRETIRLASTDSDFGCSCDTAFYTWWLCFSSRSRRFWNFTERRHYILRNISHYIHLYSRWKAAAENRTTKRQTDRRTNKQTIE